MAHTREYIKQLEKLHRSSSFGSGKKIPQPVIELLNSGKIESMLDFGSGKGLTSMSIKENYPHIKLYTYDPVTSPIDLPDEVDLMYSSDVLEHVEPDLIDETLTDLFSRAQKYQYHLIACSPAKKTLPDGRNAHLIIENPDWWKRKIQRLDEWKIIYEHIEERTAPVKEGPPRHVVKYIVILEKV